MQDYIIFTDGASKGNPGPGGWGVFIVSKMGNQVYELGGREDQTTNNRMEMMAAINALAFFEKKKESCHVVIYTDSTYLLKGVTGWMFGWEKNGWVTGAKEAVQNQDLWQELLRLSFTLKSSVSIEWQKVAGHSGVFGNERVDEIATAYAEGNRPLLFSGSVSDYEKMSGKVIDTSIVPSIVSSKKSSSKGKKAYSYVSLVDGVVKTDSTWDACALRVRGAKGAKYKKVFSAEEEKALINLWHEHA